MMKVFTRPTSASDFFPTRPYVVGIETLSFVQEIYTSIDPTNTIKLVLNHKKQLTGAQKTFLMGLSYGF
jgi:hypothetical protein